MNKILYAQFENNFVVKLVGDVRFNMCPSLNEFVEKLQTMDGIDNVVVDLTETKGLDSTALGLLAQISVYAQKNLANHPTLFVDDPNVLTTITCVGFDKLFIISDKRGLSTVDLESFDQSSESQRQIAERVLASHQVLMALSAGNKAKFRDVVDELNRELSMLDRKEDG